MSATVGSQFFLWDEMKSWFILVIAFLALFLFLLRLRLFDEIKDFEHDKIYYPDRPVSRGLISISEIKTAIWIVIILEILLSIIGGINSLLFFVIAFSYSLLMAKEFFVPKWLKSHFTVYIFSHEILLIPLYFYLFSLSGFSFKHITESNFILLTGFLFCIFFLLEVTRKMRSPKQEIKSKDTYTAQYGVLGASFFVIILSALSVFFQFLMVNSLFMFIGSVLILNILWINTELFFKNPTPKTSKKLFGFSILFFVTINILFIGALLFGI